MNSSRLHTCNSTGVPYTASTFYEALAKPQGLGGRAILPALLCVGVKGVEVKMGRSSLLWRRGKGQMYVCVCVWFFFVLNVKVSGGKANMWVGVMVR